MEQKIKDYFRDHGLKRPVTINRIGRWARGDCYAVTCGLLFLQKYCVYCIDDKIHSVRRR